MLLSAGRFPAGYIQRMDSLTRRAFLENLSVLSAGGVAAAALPSALASPGSEPHISFPTHPRERISIAAYPFRAYIVSPDNRDRDTSLPGMNLLDFPAHVVDKFNIHNIEPHSRHFTSVQPDYLESFQQVLQKTRVRAVNIAVSVSISFYDADTSTRTRAVDTAKKWVDVATHIGSPGIRTHIATARNSPPNVDFAAE